jgi:arsenate reductase (thioredoxin)
MTAPLRRRVLFLCTGNACRSQMAEAIVNQKMGGRWQAFSAGMHPAGFVHPMALQVLSEAGIPHAGTSKGLDAVKAIPFDLIVTLCDSAAKECPIWPGGGIKIHHGYDDPSQTEGSEEQQREAFRKLRDSMLSELPYLLEKHEGGKLS